MGLYIRDDEVRDLAKRIAARRGATVTAVVRRALEREDAIDDARVEEKLRALREIQTRVAALPELRPDFTDKDLYDEDGNPIL